MGKNKYLKWLAGNTATAWWHDSAMPDEIENGIANGAVGVTTNPPLIKNAVYAKNTPWMTALSTVPRNLARDDRTEEIIKRITVKIAEMFESIYYETAGAQGYVCAQVNPTLPGDRERMLEMAKRLSKWAPNIAVKLPVTAAGLDVLEECAAAGITVTATVSFTVPQVIAVAARYRKGLERAKKSGISPGKCFAVVMVGRIDDFLRDVAMDRNVPVKTSDITMAGTAIVKRAYEIFEKEKYEAVLMPAGMRGAYHATALAGGKMVLSIHPKIQTMIAELQGPFRRQIDEQIDQDVIARLRTIPEFLKAYEPQGMKPEDFISYGAVQKTLSQFVVAGWAGIEEYPILK